jgi:menaquinol-cytochrome c reductase iron-sulfur subunit
MTEENQNREPRREFFKKASCIVVGGAITAIPIAAGIRVIMDPLRQKAAGGQRIKVATIDSLPKDGTPRKISILASRADAWNNFPDAPVGAIYLRRTGDNSVEALNVVCPHAGCFVDFRAEKKGFYCPCHNSLFAIDGKIADPKSPAPRGLDTLKTEIKDNDIYVEFQNFHTGTKEKVPVA